MPLTKIVRACLLALCLLLGSLTLAPAQAAAPTDAGGKTTVAKVSPGSWKCTKWRTQGGADTRTCAKITAFDESFDVDYRRTFFNKFRKKKITVQCTTSKETTWKFGVSATVEAEAGVIFAKAKTSISGSIERSSTTTDTASATFKLKGRHYAHCERGMYEYKWRGVVKRQACHPSQGCKTWKKSYRAHAPSRDAFFIGPGRG